LKCREPDNLQTRAELAGLREQPPVVNMRHINIKEAAEFLGVTEGTLYQWVSHSPGQVDPLPFVKFSSRCLRFNSQALAEWAARRSNSGLRKGIKSDY
jgi:excisionase family DNA binding protein